MKSFFKSAPALYRVGSALCMGALVLSIAALIAGCTPKNTGSAVEITFWHYFTDPDGPVFERFVDRFNEEYAGKIHITTEFVPREELLKQYAIGAVSGELPDMGMIDNPDHAAYAALGVFQDITDLYKSWDGKAFLAGPIESCMYDGKLWGLPQASNCLALFYDKDLLNQAGIKPPETWSELEEAARLLTDPGSGRYGLAMCAIGNEEGTFQFIPFLESAGSFDDLSSPGSVEALALLERLVKNGSMSRETVNWQQADVEKQFASGSAAMMINGPWNIPALEADAPAKNWAVTKVPRADDGVHASCLGGENFVICKNANTEACWTFMTWFCGRAISEEYTSAIKKFSPRSDIDSSEQWKSDPKMALFAEVMPTAKPRGPHPRWPEISAAIYTAMQESLTGRKDAAAAMRDAQAKIDLIK